MATSPHQPDSHDGWGDTIPVIFLRWMLTDVVSISADLLQQANDFGASEALEEPKGASKGRPKVSEKSEKWCFYGK